MSPYVAGIIVIRNGIRTRFMDQRQNGGVKYALLPSGGHAPLPTNFAQPSSYTSSKLRDGALFSLCRTELQSDADRSRRVQPHNSLQFFLLQY